MIVSADFADSDGSGDATKGDKITIKLSGKIRMVGAPAAATEIANLRVGDTFGVAATIAAVGSAPSDTYVVTLGENPRLRLFGTYSTPTGSSSGIEFATNGSLRANGGRPKVGGTDIKTTLAPGFKAGATMNTARAHHTATLLADGNVLLTGGVITSGTQTQFVAGNEVYDSKANSFLRLSDPSMGGPRGFMLFNAGTPQAPRALPIGRMAHTATLLANGKVLVAGGFGFESVDAQGRPVIGELRSAFLFDPRTSSFTATGPLNVARRDHYAVRLPSGDVLVTGGFNAKLNQGKGSTLPVAEIYEVATGRFTQVSFAGNDMKMPREQGVAAPIPGGVLFTGGQAFVKLAGQPEPKMYKANGAETYLEQTHKFETTPAAPVEHRRWHTATTFLSGNVLIAGGDDGATKKTVEKYVAATKTFIKVADLKVARSRHAASRILNTADVVLVGGIAIDYAQQKINKIDSGEWYDGNKNVAEQFKMTIDRNGSRAVPLPNGRILVTGGFSGTATNVLGLGGTAVAKAETFVIP